MYTVPIPASLEEGQEEGGNLEVPGVLRSIEVPSATGDDGPVEPKIFQEDCLATDEVLSYNFAQIKLESPSSNTTGGSSSSAKTEPLEFFAPVKADEGDDLEPAREKSKVRRAAIASSSGRNSSSSICSASTSSITSSITSSSAVEGKEGEPAGVVSPLTAPVEGLPVLNELFGSDGEFDWGDDGHDHHLSSFGGSPTTTSKPCDDLV